MADSAAAAADEPERGPAPRVDREHSHGFFTIYKKGQGFWARLAAYLLGGVLVVFNTTSGAIAVPVDEILDRQQVVMKPLVGRLAAVRASWGCALLGTGEVALVLDCERLGAGVTS